MSTLLERVGPWMQAFVTAIICLAFFGTMSVLMYTLFHPTQDFPSGVKEVLLVLVGVLASSFKDCVAFWIGSSYGSARKTDLVAASPAIGRPS